MCEMRTMNMPGFTAEQFLYKTTEHHTSRAREADTNIAAVLPQLVACIRVGLPGRRRVIVCVQLPDPAPVFV